MKLTDTWEAEFARDGFIAAAREALKRSDINGWQVMNLGGFLRACERLPECDYMVGMSFKKGDMNLSAVIDSEELRLSEIVTHRFDCGEDREMRIILAITDEEVEHDDEFTLRLRDFITMAGDPECSLCVWCDTLTEVDSTA